MGAGGTMAANRLQNRRRDRGLIARIVALLTMLEDHLSQDDGKKPLSQEKFGAIEELFKSAFSDDTAVALTASGLATSNLYSAIADLRVECNALAQIWSEYMIFDTARQRGDYYRTGEAKQASFIRRQQEAAERALVAIQAARVAMMSKSTSTPAKPSI